MFTGLALICAIGASGVSNEFCIVQHSAQIYQTQQECVTETFLLKQQGLFNVETSDSKGVKTKYALKDFICFNWANPKI